MGKPLHIAIVLPNLYDSGAKKVMVSLAKGLAVRGIAVDLVVSYVEDAFRPDFPPRLRLIGLGTPKQGYRLRSFAPLVGYFREHKPQVVLPVFDFAEPLVMWASALARNDKVFGPPFLVTLHNSLSFLDDLSLPKRFIVRSLFSYMLRKAQAVVAVSRGIATEWSASFGMPQESLRVIYNPLAINEIREQAQGAVAHPWFQAGQPPVVMGVGRLSPQKDFPTLLKAFALLRETREVRLVILGEGEQLRELENLAASLDVAASVDLPGFVGNPYAYMARAAVVALSSRFEGLPTVLLEALALGKPVVSTDCPAGPREILENGKYGPLVRVGDPEALAAALASVLEDPPDAAAFRNRAGEFSLEKAVDQYLHVIEALV